HGREDSVSQAAQVLAILPYLKEWEQRQARNARCEMSGGTRDDITSGCVTRRNVATHYASLMKKHSLLFFIVLVLIASARIVATYSVFNDTLDETAHIGCGMEWLDKKVYIYEPQHPPLARLMTAMGPYMIGARY